MKIISEPLPERQVRLEIEVEPERHSLAMEQAFKRLSQRVRIPGFRPGKAPRPLVERHLGRHRILDEAMDILVPEVYREAIEEEDLDPIAGPSLELVSHEPFVFKATVPLRPAIDLHDYRALHLPREKASVSNEQVDEAITTLRRRYGTIEPAARPAQKGDIVRGSLKAEVEGTRLFDQGEIEYRLTDESLATLPGLADHIVGLEKGADVEVQVQVAEDFEDARMAGKHVSYHIALKDVKEEKLAPLDEAFARQVGEGFADVAALRERVRSDLLTTAEDAALHSFHNTVVDALVEIADIEYPSVLIEREIDRILEEQANLDPRDPRAQELYITRLGKSEKEVREEVSQAAKERLRRSLVLSKLAEAENIAVSDEDVENELQTIAASLGQQAEGVLQVFGSESGRDTIRRSLLTRRTLDRLVEIVSGEDTPKEPAAEARTKQAKRRRAEPRKAE